ncbi:hypothetical protein [Curtobacterium flaccumfaciens]|uniref:hypothetical protein n=1 Tax=Curtobacterium flaccumfaciens TaxID=2035 RepID=UPI003994873B
MIVIVSGPSAVGKNYLCEYAAAQGFRFITPFTTRLPRDGERDGEDYHFLSVEDFQDRIRANFFYDWDYVLGNYYGSSRVAIEDCLADSAVSFIHALARMAIRLKLRAVKVHTVLLLPSSEKVLESRLAVRDTAPEELDARRAHWVEEERHARLFDQVIEEADSTDASLMLSSITSRLQDSSIADGTSPLV